MSANVNNVKASAAAASSREGTLEKKKKAPATEVDPHIRKEVSLDSKGESLFSVNFKALLCAAFPIVPWEHYYVMPSFRCIDNYLAMHCRLHLFMPRSKGDLKTI